MNRRDAITSLLALGTAGGSPGLRAQSRPPRKTLGILSPYSSQDAERLWLGVFREKLKVLGWVEGDNLVIESAHADYNADHLPALAEGLVRKHVDVIRTFSGEAAIAAKRATSRVPIVFVGVPWPVETGLIESFARPGRNVTGVSTYSGIEVSTKRLEILKEVAPTATRLAWLLDAGMAATVDGGRFDARPLLDSAARSLGYVVRYHLIARREDLDTAFADALGWPAEAIAVAGGAPIYAARGRIADFALRNGLPSSCASASLVDAGGLYSYNTADTLAVSVARGVEYVDRILRGARPADLPVNRPDRYELVVNLKTAKALGLRIPQSVLLRTDRVVQ